MESYTESILRVYGESIWRVLRGIKRYTCARVYREYTESIQRV